MPKYNGVTLPVLPDHDYAYAYIFDYGATLGCHVLVLSSVAFSLYQYSDYTFQVIGDQTGQGSAVCYQAVDGAWTEVSGVTASEGGWWGTNDGTTPCVWCNTDILDPDGAVYLAASDPVPDFDLTPFLCGLALGLAGKPLPISLGKKLVGYSYNGTVLQKVPEVDGHPNAAIIKWNAKANGALYGMVLSEAPFVAEINSGKLTIKNGAISAFDLKVLHYDLFAEDGQWEAYTSVGGTVSLGTEYDGSYVWSNCDITQYAYVDTVATFYDTVAYTASEPVPVYE